MTWCIGRNQAIAEPLTARLKAMAKLRGLAKLDDPEGLVLPILVEAILMAESHRGARHQISFMPELTLRIDELIRELTAVEEEEAWAATWSDRALEVSGGERR